MPEFANPITEAHGFIADWLDPDVGDTELDDPRRELDRAARIMAVLVDTIDALGIRMQLPTHPQETP